MKAIWKIPIPIEDVFTLDMPVGAEILSAQTQDNSIQLWAMVDPAASGEPRTFRLAGTGHPLGDHHLEFIGTVQLHGGRIVFHLFEITEPA